MGSWLGTAHNDPNRLLAGGGSPPRTRRAAPWRHWGCGCRNTIQRPNLVRSLQRAGGGSPPRARRAAPWRPWRSWRCAPSPPRPLRRPHRRPRHHRPASQTGVNRRHTRWKIVTSSSVCQSHCSTGMHAHADYAGNAWWQQKESEDFTPFAHSLLITGRQLSSYFLQPASSLHLPPPTF